MADRKNPFLEIGYDADQHIPRHVPLDLKTRAVMHETNRQRVVISIMLDLHLMTLTGYIKPNAMIGLRGAISQNLEGHEGDAAAHCAPRQVLVNSMPPQQILANPPAGIEAGRNPERGWALDALFSETDVLPVNFNICDSRAERMGLNGAFLNACRQVVASAKYGGQMKPDVVATLVSNAFDRYRSDSMVAFRAAIRRLKDKLKPTFLFPHIRERWIEQLQITEQYLEAALESATVENELELSRIEGLIRVYSLE
jgi:hypothetical protein